MVVGRVPLHLMQHVYNLKAFPVGSTTDIDMSMCNQSGREARCTED